MPSENIFQQRTPHYALIQKDFARRLTACLFHFPPLLNWTSHELLSCPSGLLCTGTSPFVHFHHNLEVHHVPRINEGFSCHRKPTFRVPRTLDHLQAMAFDIHRQSHKIWSGAMPINNLVIYQVSSRLVCWTYIISDICRVELKLANIKVSRLET